MKLLSIVTSAVIALLSSAPIAAAADSASDAYGGRSKGIVTIVSAHDPGGSLPFTGLDLALVAGGGIALLGAGFGLRRLSRPHIDEA